MSGQVVAVQRERGGGMSEVRTQAKDAGCRMPRDPVAVSSSRRVARQDTQPIAGQNKTYLKINL